MTDGVRQGEDGGPGPREPSVADRRELLAGLRRVALDVETAAVLERRAGGSASAALAGVLRERAAQRRRAADRLRAAVRSAHGADQHR